MAEPSPAADPSFEGSQEYIFGTVEEMQHHFAELYEPRNALALPTQTDRIMLLGLSMLDLSDAARGRGRSTVELAVARGISRLFAVDNGVGVSLAHGLEKKFPASGCTACGQLPCNCGATRASERVDLGPDPQQFSWSLSDWQTHLGLVYGEVNVKREAPVERALNRLQAEVWEVAKVGASLHLFGADQAREAWEEETADVAGWLLGVANLFGVDSQKAVESRYGKGCPTCGRAVCVCTEQQYAHVLDTTNR